MIFLNRMNLFQSPLKVNTSVWSQMTTHFTNLCDDDDYEDNNKKSMILSACLVPGTLHALFYPTFILTL